MKVRDIMLTEMVTLGVDDELSLASDIMNLARIRHLPITENDRLVGIISQRDLFKASLASVMGHGYAQTREHLKTVSIRQVMARDVVTIHPDARARDAIQIILDKKIGCLPVVEDGKLVGLITETDLLRHCMMEHYP